METENQQPQLSAEVIAKATDETVRIAGLIGNAIGGESTTYAFPALIGVATFFATEFLQDEGARKLAAQLFLSNAVNAAFTVGLTDEELRDVIVEGQRSADLHKLGEMVSTKRAAAEEAANG